MGSYVFEDTGDTDNADPSFYLKAGMTPSLIYELDYLTLVILVSGLDIPQKMDDENTHFIYPRHKADDSSWVFAEFRLYFLKI